MWPLWGYRAMTKSKKDLGVCVCVCTTAGELRIPRRVSPFRGDEGISKKPKTKNQKQK